MRWSSREPLRPSVCLVGAPTEGGEREGRGGGMAWVSAVVVVAAQQLVIL